MVYDSVREDVFEILAIRSSNIAFTMGAKGPLWEKVHAFNGDITQY